MTTVTPKDSIKNVLGQIPFTAELYWLVRQRGKPLQSRFSLKHLQANMPEMMEQANSLKQNAKSGRNVFVFATLHYWIEHAALLSLAMGAQGNQVSLGYLPYAEWQTPINMFDFKRQNAYARKVLGQMDPLVGVVPFANIRPTYKALPESLVEDIERVTVYDTQYTLQVEDVDTAHALYKLRKERNEEAARKALAWFKTYRPDVVVVPNGTVQELGIIYRVARHLQIPVTTYEFGDQRQRIWLAQNAEVMQQETLDLWNARQQMPLTEAQMERLQSLFMARQRAAIWENFARLWQDTPAKGGERVRAELGLDERPVVMLATNVLGDSLTLGRQIFSSSMAEWISRTVQYFTGRPDVQLVIRVHPGEILTHGQSMADVVRSVLPILPEHIRLIDSRDKQNTYDLMEVADLGLVYTTTVGLEMSMMGLPVIVTGKTHYRGRGFTCDPDTWVAYYKLIGQILENPADFRLKREQVELAWQYAYRFFFEFPRPFPWHLVKVWEDYKTRPMQHVLGEEGQEQYGNTFNYLMGEPLDWTKITD
jgi:hypothetical protein